jgi:hypothetical protein
MPGKKVVLVRLYHERRFFQPTAHSLRPPLYFFVLLEIHAFRQLRKHFVSTFEMT